MIYDSFMPARIFSGAGCLRAHADALLPLGKKCLIVTGGSSAKKSGALFDTSAVLDELKIEYGVFDKIGENPLTRSCHDAGATARGLGAEFIIGIGGGSPLDAAKAVAIYASNEELSPSDIYLRKYKNAPLPVVLIGTTSGTGSEVTGVSVLTNSDTGYKKSISGPDCYSVISFCDYKYTCSMPMSVTVSTALDAFCHASESFFASSSNEISSLYAKKALELVFPYLKAFDENCSLPDDRGRELLYEASIFAGLAINITGTCFPHTVGYILTEDYGIPHGRACAAFSRDFLKICGEYKPRESEEFYKILNSNPEAVANICDRLADVSASMTGEQAGSYAERWRGGIKNFDRTPGSFTADTALEILKKYVSD